MVAAAPRGEHGSKAPCQTHRIGPMRPAGPVGTGLANGNATTEGATMIVETSVTVTRAMLSDDHRRWRLIQEARHRLVELGLATLDQLDQKPSITPSVQEIGGEATPWVHVTFSWQLPE